ncbi:MAG: DUF1573 domain-containing protein [bacterium]|nr:DUF1573 domain-containing protein [bacterium]
MNTIIVWIIGGAALLGALFFLGAPDGQRPASGAETPSAQAAVGASLLFSETAFDFGTISMEKGVVTHTFLITNTSSSSPITLTRIVTSCMCTEASLKTPSGTFGPFGMPGHGGVGGKLSHTIAAGESREIEVVFDPAAHGPSGVGRITRGVIIEEKGGGTNTIEISALVTP